MTAAENITAMLDLCDKHADQFKSTLHGQFTPESVKRDIEKLQMLGFAISDPRKMKRDEIRRHKKPRTRKTGETKISICQMRRKIEDVDNQFREGHGITEAARLAGICDKTYRSYCEKTGTTPINKRQWVKMASGEVLTNEV